MKVNIFNNNPVRSNMYILEEDGRAIIVDPSVEDVRLTKCKVEYIILTHEHYDHICAVNYWRNSTGAIVIASRNCQKGLQDPLRNFSRFYKEFCELQTMVKINSSVKNCEYMCSADIIFDKEYNLNWNFNTLKLFECPGHSMGSICILLNNKLLFCGDTLFKDYPITTGMPGGSKRQWVKYGRPSLETLSKDIIVYPGHFESFLLNDYRFWEVIR